MRGKSPGTWRRGGLSRSALISKISLQFIAFFTTPFISEISRAPAKISYQYAERTGEEKTCRGSDTGLRQGDEGASEKRSIEKRTDERTKMKKLFWISYKRPVHIERLQLFSTRRLLIITRACIYSIFIIIKTWFSCAHHNRHGVNKISTEVWPSAIMVNKRRRDDKN